MFHTKQALDGDKVLLLQQPVSTAVVDYILANAASQLTSPEAVTVNAIKLLLKGGE
jgi:hypothetical protein